MPRLVDREAFRFAELSGPVPQPADHAAHLAGLPVEDLHPAVHGVGDEQIPSVVDRQVSWVIESARRRAALAELRDPLTV